LLLPKREVFYNFFERNKFPKFYEENINKKKNLYEKYFKYKIIHNEIYEYFNNLLLYLYTFFNISVNLNKITGMNFVSLKYNKSEYPFNNLKI